MDLQNQIDIITNKFKDDDYKETCENYGNPKCLSAKIIISKLKDEVTKKMLLYQINYYNCLKDAYDCEEKSYRNIWANLTETSFCLKRREKCINDYSDQLKETKKLYDRVADLDKVLYKN